MQCASAFLHFYHFFCFHFNTFNSRSFKCHTNSLFFFLFITLICIHVVLLACLVVDYLLCSNILNIIWNGILSQCKVVTWLKPFKKYVQWRPFYWMHRRIPNGLCIGTHSTLSMRLVSRRNNLLRIAICM